MSRWTLAAARCSGSTRWIPPGERLALLRADVKQRHRRPKWRRHDREEGVSDGARRLVRRCRRRVVALPEEGLAAALCRALKVLCVARDHESLMQLRNAAVSAEWELAAGATNEADAIGQLDTERPHVLVVFGPYERLVSLVRERFPGMRVIADRDVPGTTAVATSLGEVRALIKSSPRPGGPVI